VVAIPVIPPLIQQKKQDVWRPCLLMRLLLLFCPPWLSHAPRRIIPEDSACWDRLEAPSIRIMELAEGRQPPPHMPSESNKVARPVRGVKVRANPYGYEQQQAAGCPGEKAIPPGTLHRRFHDNRAPADRRDLCGTLSIVRSPQPQPTGQ